MTAAINSTINTAVTDVKMARLPLNWGETVSELVVGVVLSGEIDSVVVAVSGIIHRGQSSRGEELFTQRGDPILPVSGGFDRVSVQEKKIIQVKFESQS